MLITYQSDLRSFVEEDIVVECVFKEAIDFSVLVEATDFSGLVEEMGFSFFVKALGFSFFVEATDLVKFDHLFKRYNY